MLTQCWLILRIEKLTTMLSPSCLMSPMAIAIQFGALALAFISLASSGTVTQWGAPTMNLMIERGICVEVRR